MRAASLVVWIFACPYVASEIFYLNAMRTLSGNRPPPGSPWPLPKLWHHNESIMTFSPANLTLKTDLNSCDLIYDAFNRLVNRLTVVRNSKQEREDAILKEPTSDLSDFSANSRNDNTNTKTWIQEIEVHVTDAVCPDYPQFDEQENYNLDVTSKITLQAPSVWGIIWGFETLGQLMFMVDDKWYINRTSIQDEPRFKHRGLHFDTARHYYKVALLKQNLDAMASNKLNVFHWHIVDTQAFPYRSIRFPQLAEKGAFSAHQTYTQGDIKDVIEYARVRGIRVIPEFDTPGHAYSWGKGIPELLTPCWLGNNPSVRTASENMDPSKNYTFQFLGEFFQEISDLFVDQYLHLGMDEASYACWRSNPDISAFMSRLGLSPGDYTGLEQYYDERLLSLVYGMGRKAVIWEDPVNNGANISKNTLIHLWKDYNLGPGEFQPWPTYMKPILSAGYHVIFSSCWYLNYIHYGQDWKDLYTCDPTTVAASEEELSRILGGEACTWSEYLDENNVLQVVWPRAAAVAERLWSAANITNTDDAAFRLDQHRCRLVRQNIPAAPISPGYCQDDYNTDNSDVQHPQVTDQIVEKFSSITSSLTKSDEIPIIG